MASNIQIKRRITLGTPGTPAALVEGEVAFNRSGLNADDEAAGGALFVGDGTAVQNLVTSARQVELAANQNIAGIKTFTGDMGVGSIPGTNDYRFPNARGAASQILQMNAGATALEFANAAAVVIVSAPIAGTGVVEVDFNAVTDWTGIGDQVSVPFTVNAGEMWILDHNGSAYVWGGGTGTFGTSAGGTPAVNADFIPLGAATGFATANDVQVGTATNLAIAPNVAASDLFRTNAASGAQSVDVASTFLKNVSFAGNNTGFYFANGRIECFNGQTLRGQNLTTDALTIDNAILDGGTF